MEVPVCWIHADLVLDRGRVWVESVRMAPNSPLSFVERSYKAGDPVSQSLSEHTGHIQNHKSYSEHANSFAAGFVHINARVP